MRLLLALRALFFVLLLPGTVAGYIPFSILRAGNLLRVPDLVLASVCAAVFDISGALVILRCVLGRLRRRQGHSRPYRSPTLPCCPRSVSIHPQPYVQRRHRPHPRGGVALPEHRSG